MFSSQYTKIINGMDENNYIVVESNDQKLIVFVNVTLHDNFTPKNEINHTFYCQKRMYKAIHNKYILLFDDVSNIDIYSKKNQNKMCIKK